MTIDALQRRVRLLGSVALSAVAFTAVPALAQATAPTAAPADDTATEDNSGGLGDIIVTARKVEENIQNVPVAITAYSGQDLVNQNVQRVQDLARFTSGMTMRNGSSTPAALTITLRGQVQTDIIATLDPSVGTYVDGLYWARAYGLNGSLVDMQSVQVLKGPQGTLFGRNTTGGAVLMNSNNPRPGEFSGMAQVSYGRYNELGLTGVLNVPLISDVVTLRVAGQRLTRDGYNYNVVTGHHLDDRDRLNLRAKLLIEPTDNLSLLFSGEYFNMDEAAFGRQLTYVTNAYTASNSTYTTAGTAQLYAGLLTCSAGQAPAGSNCTAAGWSAVGRARDLALAATLADNPNTVYSAYDPFAKARTYTYGFTGTLDSAIGQFKLIAGYRRVTSTAGVDLASDGFNTHFTVGDQRLSQHSVEFQWTGKAFNDALDFVFGAFTFHEQGFDDSLSITLPLLNTLNSHFWGHIDNDSNGVYTQMTYHLNDRLSFTGGIRYSVDDKGLTLRTNTYNRTTHVTTCSIISGSYTFTNPAVTLANGISYGVGEVMGPEQCAATRRDSFSGISYTLGAEYQINDDILLYVRHAKGFRSGGQNLRAPNLNFFLPFQPEIAYSYEAGFKSEWFDRRVRLNVAVYQSDVNDIQRSTLVANIVNGQTLTATILGNAGKARFRGLEADLQVAITPELRLTASGALTDPKYIRYSDLSGDRSGEHFGGVAKSQWSIAADYARDLGSVGLNLHADYSWTGRQYAIDYNFPANPENSAIIAATTIPATGLLGARAALTFGDGMYELAVYGRNLTNNRDHSLALAVLPVGYIAASRLEPRTYGVSATVRF